MEDTRKALKDITNACDILNQEKNGLQTEIQPIQTERDEQYAEFARLGKELETVIDKLILELDERDKAISCAEEKVKKLTKELKILHISLNMLFRNGKVSSFF